MHSKSITMTLFDPGMTRLHQVGLAGLYMTLKAFSQKEFREFGGWELTDTSITLYWEKTPKKLLENIIQKTFMLKNGCIWFSFYGDSGISDLTGYLIHNAILKTFLQFGTHKKKEKMEQTLSFRYEDKEVQVHFVPLQSYYHQNQANKLFNSKGEFKQNMELIGWLFPGGAVRHNAYQSATKLAVGPESLLCLYFSPCACPFFIIRSKTLDGKSDKRKGAAIVLPEIRNLEEYHKGFKEYLASPEHSLYAVGLGEAGLNALIRLNMLKEGGFQEDLEFTQCSVVTMGVTNWAKQQKTRTSLFEVRNMDTASLKRFENAMRLLENRIVIKEDKTYYIQTSICRGRIGDNIASGKEWFQDFFQVMRTGKLAKQVYYEKEGLLKMVKEKNNWNREEDQRFVEAVHTAIRNRYGALASRARKKGESIRFDREYESIRTSLMRAKNPRTLRAEIADLFARGGINQSLKDHWRELLELFTGEDWERARDLALLGLASYSGVGSQEVEINQEPMEDEEE